MLFSFFYYLFVVVVCTVEYIANAIITILFFFLPFHSSGCEDITVMAFVYFAVAPGAQASKCHFSAKGVSFSC